MEQEVNNQVDVVANQWLGSCSELLHNRLVDSSLSYICRREYIIECNWKVRELHLLEIMCLPVYFNTTYIILTINVDTIFFLLIVSYSSMRFSAALEI